MDNEAGSRQNGRQECFAERVPLLSAVLGVREGGGLGRVLFLAGCLPGLQRGTTSQRTELSFASRVRGETSGNSGCDLTDIFVPLVSRDSQLQWLNYVR